MDITGQRFSDQVVRLNDGGKHYVDCTFERCTFYLEDPRRMPLFINCELVDCALAGEEQAIIVFREWTGYRLPWAC